MGPPVSRRWALAIWKSKHDFENKKRASQEMELLKIQSVQPDPTRNHVFVINYYDDSRVRQVCTFRRVDRDRDAWVELLRRLVTAAHEARKATKEGKTSRLLPDVRGFRGKSPGGK